MLRDKMLAVMQEVNSEIAEREELIQTIAMALLSGNDEPAYRIGAVVRKTVDDVEFA